MFCQSLKSISILFKIKFERSVETKEEQPLNIEDILVTLDISKLERAIEAKKKIIKHIIYSFNFLGKIIKFY